jgi:hypothetical protein
MKAAQAGNHGRHGSAHYGGFQGGQKSADQDANSYDSPALEGET